MSQKILILCGGWHGERAVSLVTGQAVLAACQRLSLEPVLYDWQSPDPRPVLAKIDRLQPEVIFNALHGLEGEDGVPQALAQLCRIPITHSGVTASATAMDKRLSRMIAGQAGLTTAKAEAFAKGQELPAQPPLDMPIMIKPSADGSSVGIQPCFDATSWQKYVAACHGKVPYDLLCEERIDGIDVTVAVWHPDPSKPAQALGVTALVPSEALRARGENGFYSYTAKYDESHLMQHVVNPDNQIVPENIQQQARAQAVKIHGTMGCRGISRTDFMFGRDRSQGEQLVFFEINTQPGMTPSSLAPEQAEAIGMSFDDIVKGLIESAVLWHDHGHQKDHSTSQKRA